MSANFPRRRRPAVGQEPVRRGGQVYFADAKFSGGQVSFDRAGFSGQVSFDYAGFSGGQVSFTAAEFSGQVTVTFNGARFSDGQVRFDGARFSGGQVRFAGAVFSGSQVSFGSAGLWSSPPVFDWDHDRSEPPAGVVLPDRRGILAPPASFPYGMLTPIIVPSSLSPTTW